MNQPLPRSTDVEIDGKRYQIIRMNPLIGSWVASQVFTRMLPSGLEAQFMDQLAQQGAPISKLPASREPMGMDDFIKLQLQCLQVCKWYDGVSGKDIATPVITAGGVFVNKDLEGDPVSVLALSIHALLFNMQPFFEKGRIAPVLESFQSAASKQSDSAISTLSVSGQ